MAGLPRPVFGYIGVVDERIDYELLARLADSTQGSVVMVGPWTKVDPASFPRRDNLHWLGSRDYSDLPGYAKGFDVCIMPFAMNEATRFINPTKALEYMATGRPIVSTPVEDVVAQFSDVITIAQGFCKRLRMPVNVPLCSPTRSESSAGLRWRREIRGNRLSPA